MDANGKAVLVFNTSGLVIENNVITNTLDKNSGTLRFEGNVHDVLMRGNTVYNNLAPGVAVDAIGWFSVSGLPPGPLRFLVRQPGSPDLSTGWFVG